MKILTPIGSKERLFEMFQGVNKFQLNEVVTDTMQTGTQLVEKAFEELVNQQAQVKQTNTQTDNDVNYVEIVTGDKEGNEITFTFKINSSEADQDGVFNMDNAVLSKFAIKSPRVNVEMPEEMKAVQEFNAKHSGEIMDVVSQYADFDTDTVSVDNDVYAEAVSLIDKIPYKKGSEEIQTHKNYADNKPTNPEVRVDNDELQKFVKEEEEEFIPHGSYTVSNTGGYEIMLNDAGDAARVRDAFGSDNPQTSDWLEIEYLPDEETGESEPVIDPQGYNIPLNMVMRIQETDMDLQKFVKEMEDMVASAEEEDIMALPPEPTAADMAAAMPQSDDDGTTGIDPYDLEPEYDGGEASAEDQALFSQAYDNLVAAGNQAPNAVELENEVNRLQGNVKPVEKTRAIPKGAEQFYESTDQDKFEDVVFMQGEEADEALEILRNQGEDAAMQHLMQWHSPGQHMGSAELGHGSSDQTYEKDGYHMAWNFPLNYIGLSYELSGLDEEEEKTYPDPIGKKFKPKRQFPKKKKKISTDVKLSEESEIPQEYWGKEEDFLGETEEIPDEKPEDGDFIEGGLADDEDVSKYDPKEISMGIEVEMEHTKDPKVALEIAMDHLEELPDYYTRLQKMEAEAGVDEPEGDATDSEAIQPMEGMGDNTPEEAEITDELLGYKPHNVGDYAKEELESPIPASPDQEKQYWDKEYYKQDQEIEEPADPDVGHAEYLKQTGQMKSFDDASQKQEIIDEEGDFDEYAGEIGDRYEDANNNQFTVRDKVEGGVTLQGQGGEKEIATQDLQFMKKLSEDVELARQVLKNRRLDEGMTKKQAVQILIKHNIK